MSTAPSYRVYCPECKTGTYVQIPRGEPSGIAECPECGHRWEAQP